MYCVNNTNNENVREELDIDSVAYILSLFYTDTVNTFPDEFDTLLEYINDGFFSDEAYERLCFIYDSAYDELDDEYKIDFINTLSRVEVPDNLSELSEEDAEVWYKYNEYIKNQKEIYDTSLIDYVKTIDDAIYIFENSFEKIVVVLHFNKYKILNLDILRFFK